MKNYSLVKKLSSSFWLVTLSSSIISGIGTEKTFADGEFIKSKLFVALCDFFTDDKLKTIVEKKDVFFEEQEKDSDKNIERLRGRKLWSLVMLWKFAENVIKNEENPDKKSTAQRFKKDLETVLKGDLSKKIEELFKSKELKGNVSLIFKGIKSDAKTITEIFDASTCRDLFFEKNSGLYIKGSLEKYSDTVKKLYYNYFYDSSMYGHKKFTDIVKFIEFFEFIKTLLKDSSYIKNLKNDEANKKLIDFSVNSEELLYSKFCSKEEMVRVFSAFADKFPENSDLRKVVKELTKVLNNDGAFKSFISGYAFSSNLAMLRENSRSEIYENTVNLRPYF